ncbi:MAG: DMT family transporter [Sphaerochaetaceae bacterium]
MKKNVSILLIFLATVGYGLMPIFTLIAYRHQVSPSELVLLRFAGAALIMWLYLAIAKKTAFIKTIGLRGALRIVIMLGIPFSLSIVAKFVAFTTMPVGVVQAIFYGYPLLVMLIGIAIGRETFHISRLFGYLIIFGGILLTLDLKDTRITVTGLLLSFFATFIYSWYILSIRDKKVLPISSDYITSFVMIAGTLVILIAFPFMPNNAFTFSKGAWWGIAGLILISTVGSFHAFNTGAKHVEGSLASIIMCFEPIVTIIFEILFLGGHYSVRQYIGIILIPAGIILSLVLSRQKQQTEIPNGKSD